MDDIIRFEHVVKDIGRRHVLEDISLTVSKGDIFGFLGPNGAGKTTSIRIALGLLRPDSGKVLVLGKNPEIGGVRRQIGVMLDVDGLYNDMTAQENLTYYAELYGVNNASERIRRNVEMAGLSDRMGEKVGSYSKGMRQRLSLARLLLHDPGLLVLDEPTSGVDPTGQIELRRMLLDMAHQQGKTIFFSSHNLDEVQRICNRIALIDRGQIRLAGELAEIERTMGHGGVVIETSEPVSGALMSRLRNLPGVEVESQEGTILKLSANGATMVPAIVHLLDSGGAQLEEVKKQGASIEDVYSAIVKEAEGG